VAEYCFTCCKRIYPVDRVSIEDRVYHKGCFRCATCQRIVLQNSHPRTLGCAESDFRGLMEVASIAGEYTWLTHDQDKPKFITFHYPYQGLRFSHSLSNNALIFMLLGW
ncbi:hypothetical protein FBUS_00342, partial [Fasciolopsis buskii]